MKKTRSRGFEKTVAIVTINDADIMTREGRASVAKWLREKASDLVKNGRKFSKCFRARYVVDRRIK